MISITLTFRKSYSNKTYDFVYEVTRQADWTLDHVTRNCKPPCHQTTIRSTFLINTKGINFNRTIELAFKRSIKVIILPKSVLTPQLSFLELKAVPTVHDMI